MSSAAELQTIEGAIKIFQITKWCQISALALYMCDFIATMDEEINLIWNTAWVPGKVLFLLMRYITLVALIFFNTIINLANPSDAVSLIWIRFHWVLGTIVGLIAELTLALRLYAMYDRTRKILVLLVLSFLSTLAGALAVIIYINRTEQAEFLYIGPLPAQHMCVPTNLSRYFKLYWVPFIANEILMFALAVSKGVENSRLYKTQNRPWRRENTGGRFLRFLVRDSVIYFFCVNASLVASEIVWMVGGVDYIEVPLGLAMAAASIWSQRLLLNVRKHRTGYGNELIVSANADSSVPEFCGSEREFVLETFRTLEHNRVHRYSTKRNNQHYAIA